MAKGCRRVGSHHSSPFLRAPHLRFLVGKNSVTTVPCQPRGPSRYLMGSATLSCATQSPYPSTLIARPLRSPERDAWADTPHQ